MITPGQLKQLATKKPPEKIGENHVIVKFVLFSEDRTEVLIHTEEYGQNRIDKGMEKINREISGLDAYKQTRLDKLIAERGEFEDIQTEMNKKFEKK